MVDSEVVSHVSIAPLADALGSDIFVKSMSMYLTLMLWVWGLHQEKGLKPLRVVAAIAGALAQLVFVTGKRKKTEAKYSLLQYATYSF